MIWQNSSDILSLGCNGNPHAKRLYDDLLSNYNRLIRPVNNDSDTLTVKLGLKLSQLIDVVSLASENFMSFLCSPLIFDSYVFYK